MAETTTNEKGRTPRQQLERALRAGDTAEVRRRVKAQHPAEIALLLESLPVEERARLWRAVEREQLGPILTHLSDPVRAGLIALIDPDELVAITADLAPDDLADLLQEFPEAAVKRFLGALDAEHRRRLEAVLPYPEDSAGGLMNVDTVTVRPEITLDVIQRYLRWRRTVPEATDSLMVVNRHGRYLGLLPLTDLLVNPTDLTVAEVMRRDVAGIPADTSTHVVAQLFERRDLISAPVVDAEGRLLGRITIDDVVDVIRDEGEHAVMGLAGLSEDEDLFAPVATSSRRRALWLGINLLTALLASWVIGLFGATIQKMVALAVLMPIVASMGGIAGSQTLTVVIRGVALGQVGGDNARRLLFKELAVSLINGLLWAAVIGAVAVFWFGNDALGLVIGAAMVVNLLIAALSGALIPFILRSLGADPALAGSVVLTTITDVVGFLVFLGLARLFLV